MGIGSRTALPNKAHESQSPLVYGRGVGIATDDHRQGWTALDKA